jgi:hypothetical protein
VTHVKLATVFVLCLDSLLFLFVMSGVFVVAIVLCVFVFILVCLYVFVPFVCCVCYCSVFVTQVCVKFVKVLIKF